MSTETHTPKIPSENSALYGPTKPYNVRLTISLVADAMNDPRSGDLSLAGLIDLLLLEYVEREVDEIGVF